MRVIGGKFKGRKLNQFRGMKIRPTADRVREAVFNILGPRVRNASVLDLFAGTGALGIEALSRGAGYAVFVDNHPAATEIIRRNLDTCNAMDRSRVVKWDIAKNLYCLKSLDIRFDLVLMDPPYAGRLLGRAIRHLCDSLALTKDARIVAEHSDTEPIPDMAPTIDMIDQRRYGKTLVSIFVSMV